MKRKFTLLGLSLMLLATVAFAQRRMDDANEKAVHIVDGPRIDNITGHSAVIDWAAPVPQAPTMSAIAWRAAINPGGRPTILAEAPTTPCS